MTFPRTFSHIGISVTDLDLAVDFYTRTLGWYVIMPRPLRITYETARPNTARFPELFQRYMQSEPHVKLMDVTGKVMRGWALVETAGITTNYQLKAWVRRAAKFAASLPAK